MSNRRGKIQSFDLLDSPLQGTNLIEASAGTGKTYTITCLFLRLILEKRFPVKDILVVTYTVAATEELRDRTRKKIREAIGAYSTGDSEDLFLKGLIQKVPDAEDALNLLQAALRDFDEAAIFTIHGFCQRTLHESAFESGGLFDTELEPEQETGLMEEIVQDFWRRHFYNAPFEFVSYAQSQGYGPDFFLALLRKRVPDLKIIPEVKPTNLSSLKTFSQEFVKLKGTWPKVREQVLAKLSDPGLNKVTYKNPVAMAENMDEYLAAERPAFPLFKGFEKFTPAGLESGTKKNQVTPKHPYFDLCREFKEKADALIVEMDQQLLFLKGEIFRYLEKELPARKQRQNIQSFDDLLIRLRDSLEKAGGDDLSGAIRKKYHAALIDEFQDTDPVQYAIFQNVFGKGGAILFLIGDPKQAIYSFRGADLFAYMKAAGRVDSRYTLTRNWRSEPNLITAINTIFENGDNPFLYKEIPFETAAPKEEKDHEFLKINGKSEPPFQLWFVDSGEVAEGKSINKGVAYNLIPEAVAAEISRLILLGRKGRVLIGDEPLREADLAVLVRTNNEAQLVQQALSELRIPSVLYSTGNLFDTHEAMEMSRVLEGIANPHQEGLIRAALATDVMGVTGETIESLSRDEAAWEEWLSRFRDYYEMWERNGFIQMFRYFLLREKVRSRLVSLPNGERRLTNVLHLSEVLHQAAIEEKLGMVGLLKWLARQRDSRSARLEEHQLRLESDANAVKIVTIHKSKGLEYPIVFCPFNWGRLKIDPDEPFTFHDEEDDWRLNLVLDPESSPKRVLSEKEELAENIRLLYVSLTRAKNRCYLVWGRFKDAETSSLSYVLHPPGKVEGNVVEEIQKHFKDMTDEDIREELKGLSRKSKGAILLKDMPTGPGEEILATGKESEELSGKAFSAPIPRDWQIASFSSLTAGLRGGAESLGYAAMDIPDHDQATLPEEPVLGEKPFSIFTFPKGAKAGSFLHDILENFDFTEKESAVIRELVVGKLREYGFGKEWQETVVEMIAKVLSAPLLPSSKGFNLSRVSRKERLSEMEFYFPLQRITPKHLRKIFADHGGPEIPGEFPERIGDLNFLPARGYMKGFIDLIFQFQGRFYIVDWKSNFLGNRVEDYNQGKMAGEMEENFYLLQSNLYALALHQYLKNRMPKYRYTQHFGGVFYIFLRGVDAQVGGEFGIYKDFPKEELVEALSRNLISPPVQ
jgi:exodeoxyribonuclease V beta subunit